MKAGDYVKMRSEEGIWYGEVVGIKTDTLEVYYIEKGDDNVWAYSEEWHEVPKESVLEHIKTSNVIQGLKDLGFRPLSDSTFAKIDETGTVPIGDPAFDNFDENSDNEEMDFIVPDEEGEPFSLAPLTSEFVRETHQAVRAFNRWNPEGEARRVKDFIDRLSNKTIDQENGRTRLGEAISYNQPPI